MRCGLVDEAGFEAFAKEVIMLARLDHPNIVTFVGYSLSPVLLIVMEFVDGGKHRNSLLYISHMSPLKSSILLFEQAL